MAMTTDSRAAFEYWARSKGLDVTRWNERKRGPLPNEYMKLDTDMAWSGWQARHHLTQPAQAVDVWAGEIECCDADGFWLVLADDCPFVPGQKVTITAAIPKDSNGAEGV